MDKVQTSCTSHLKHLQAMHGEELATIYAEMTQARSAAEELFEQKEEATAKIERLQQRMLSTTQQGQSGGGRMQPQQQQQQQQQMQMPPFGGLVMPLPPGMMPPLPPGMMPMVAFGAAAGNNSHQRELAADEDEDRQISMSVAKAVQERALSKLHDEHRQTIEDLEDALAEKTSELEQLRQGLEAEKLREVVSMQHGYEAKLQAKVREETERMQQVLLEVVNKVTQQQPQSPPPPAPPPPAPSLKLNEDEGEMGSVKLAESNAKLRESHERAKVHETMMMEMAEKANLKQTEVHYLTESCQDLVEGIATKQREVEKLQQMVEVQSSQLKQAAKENAQLAEFQAQAEGEILLLQEQVSQSQSKLDRNQSVILQHQMGFDRLQHEMSSLSAPPAPAAQLADDASAKEAMQQRYEQQMQEQVSKLQALHEKDMDQLQATHEQDMKSLEAANATNALRLKGQMNQDVQAMIDEKVKDRVALKQQEQRRHYQQQVEQLEKQKQRELSMMKKEFDETLWMLESQHQKDMQQRLREEPEQTRLEAGARRGQNTRPKARSPDAAAHLVESAEARLSNAKEQGRGGRNDTWFLGLEEWQVVAAQQMAATVRNRDRM